MIYLMNQNESAFIQELIYLRERIICERLMIKKDLILDNVASIQGFMGILKKYEFLITPVLEKFKTKYLSEEGKANYD